MNGERKDLQKAANDPRRGGGPSPVASVSEASPLRFFDPWASIDRSGDRLPHWQQPGATYFLTWRLADSIPATLFQQLEDERVRWLRFHPRPWSSELEREFHQRFSAQLERWLDEGRGACPLRAAAASAVVAEALNFHDGDRYVQHAWVVMPNHVHIVCSLHPERRLEKVIQTWKSVTAHRLGAGGTFWQQGYFDRIIRDEKHFANCVRYIRRNPEKAGLRAAEYRLYESALAAEIE